MWVQVRVLRMEKLSIWAKRRRGSVATEVKIELTWLGKSIENPDDYDSVPRPQQRKGRHDEVTTTPKPTNCDLESEARVFVEWHGISVAHHLESVAGSPPGWARELELRKTRKQGAGRSWCW